MPPAPPATNCREPCPVLLRNEVRQGRRARGVAAVPQSVPDNRQSRYEYLHEAPKVASEVCTPPATEFGAAATGSSLTPSPSTTPSFSSPAFPSKENMGTESVSPTHPQFTRRSGLRKLKLPHYAV